jgi:hypothetical protein
MHQLALEAREKYAMELLHINEVMKHIATQANKGFMFAIIENKQGIPQLENTTYAQGLHKRLSQRGYKLLWQEVGDYENLKIMWGGK